MIERFTSQQVVRQSEISAVIFHTQVLDQQV